MLIDKFMTWCELLANRFTRQALTAWCLCVCVDVRVRDFRIKNRQMALEKYIVEINND